MVLLYDDTVPQGNQQIANTQAPIQSNFAYLQTYIGQEHNFDDTGALTMYHLQASMPNKALSPSLPSGTNGQYFVSSGDAYFYDGTNNFNLNSGATSAWVNFSVGASPGFAVTINSQYNVSSVTRGTPGNYVVTFTTRLPSANYAWSINGFRTASPSTVLTSATPAAMYGLSVKNTSIAITFADRNGGLIDPQVGVVTITGF